MCGTCGCENENSVRITRPGHEQHENHEHPLDHSHEGEHRHGHTHEHNHEHGHDHTHSHDHQVHHHSKEIELEVNVLYKNNLLAERNRGYFEAKGITALNLVSSPGSGKTSLLERTIKDMGKPTSIFVIEGDQQTTNDAARIENAGAPAVQINTGNGCHLDADMISKAVKTLEIKEKSILFIENVGNLVCPSMFDLGENKRVVIISVTEGEDKPLKYPTMFETSHLCIINKTDLLPYVDFKVEEVINNARKVNHHLEFIELSVRSGEGMQEWYNWLKKESGL